MAISDWWRLWQSPKKVVLNNVTLNWC
jgi:hypothetical protein